METPDTQVSIPVEIPMIRSKPIRSRSAYRTGVWALTGRWLSGIGTWMLLAGTTLVTAGSASAAEVKVSSSAGTAQVSVIRRVELDYYLVTKAKSLEFRVSGPTWLKVYTRLWWPESGLQKANYSLSLWQEDMERSLVFETELSPSSFGPVGQKLAKWRSFYIQVPDGDNWYRLTLEEAPSGTVGVRFTYEKPAEWQQVNLNDARRLELVGESRRTTLYELRKESPLSFSVTGPCRLRVRARLNYGPEMDGRQNFILSIREGDSVLQTANLRTARSAAVYDNEVGFLPSREETMKIRLGPGEHRLDLKLSGTLAGSAAVRVERIADQIYE